MSVLKPDNEGKVILDYGIYLVESEVNEQKPAEKDTAGECHSVSAADKPFQGPLPEMLISDVGPYSVDAESNLFFVHCPHYSLSLKTTVRPRHIFAQGNRATVSIAENAAKAPT